MAWGEWLEVARRAFGERGRRVTAIGGRATIEHGPVAPGRRDGFEAALRAALDRAPGVTSVHVDRYTRRVLVAYDAGRTSLPDLVAIVEVVEEEHEAGPLGLADAERVLPDDPELEAQRILEAGLAAGGLALGLVLRFVPFVPRTTGALSVALLGVVQRSPRLRGRLDETFGKDRADLLLNAAIAGAQAIGQRPMSSTVDITEAVVRVRDLRARRRLWDEAAERFVADVPAASHPTATREVLRPVPLPRGPVERSLDRAAFLSPASFALSLATTRSPRRAAAALFSAFPKPARVGREVFVLELSRMLASRGSLVLSHAALHRLDRVDCLVLDGSLISRGKFLLGEVVPDADADADKVRAHVAALFDPDRPLEEQRGGGLRLVPLSLRARELGPEVEAQASALVARGALVLALSEGDRILGLAEVQTKPQAGIEEVIKSAYSLGMRVAFAGIERSESAGLGADEILRGGAHLADGLRTLQRAGHVVCYVTRGGSPALPVADLGVSLLRPGEAFPSGAHVVCPDDVAVLRTLLRATVDARRVSEQSERLALGAAAIGAFASAGGGTPSAVGRVIFAVNAASFLSMANGARHGQAVERYRTRPVDPTPWHALEPEAVLARLGGTRDGLSEAEARVRAAPDRLPPSAVTELGTAIGQEMTNPLTPLLAAGAGLSAMVGSSADAGIVATVAGVNGVVGGVQRFRAERRIRELERNYRPRSRVRRAGLVVDVDSAELVAGDVIVFEPGDVIPADCRLLESDSVEVDSASMTGESLPVPKSPRASFEEDLPERASMLYAGTSIASGRGSAVVVATGADTEAQRAIIQETAGTRKGGVEARLEELMDLTMPLAGTAAAAILGTGILRGRPVDELVATAVSLGVASVPEGLPLLATAAQLAAARRLAGRGVLVRNVRAIEALGRVDVICMDKTGTLTEGRVELSRVSDGDRLVSPSELREAHRDVLVSAMRATFDPRSADAVSDPLDRALVRGAARAGVSRDSYAAERERLSEQAFESGRGFHSVLVRVGEELVLDVKGSPEVLIEKSARRKRGDKTPKLNALGRKKLLAHAQELAKDGLRVIAVARRESPPGTPPLEAAQVRELTFLGFVAFSDPVRPSAARAVSGLGEAGVRVLMLTGDHPTTAGAIATEVGLPGATRVVVGSTLDAMDDEALAACLADSAVFARVTPAQKTRIVRALQRAGHVVAMAGDGANDAPAIRLADVGLAVGRDCTPAARAVADVVLTDERIDNAVRAIIEGRGMWASVRNAVSILLGGNLGEIGFTVGAGLLAGRPPLSPRQLLLVNFLTDIAPAIAVALRPPEEEAFASLVHEGPDRSLRSALDREILARAVVTGAGAGAAWAVGRLTGSRQRASTIGLVSLVGTQLGQTLASGPTRGVTLTSVGSAVALATIVQTPGLSQLFGCRPLGPLGWATALGASLAATGASRYVAEGVDFAADLASSMADRGAPRLWRDHEPEPAAE